LALADVSLHPDHAPRTLLEAVKEQRDNAVSVLQPFWEAIEDELAFCLDLDHYESDSGNVRDRTRIQPRTLALYHTVRHKASQVSSSEIYIDCLPVDDYGDNETAEWCRFALEKEILDQTKRYKARRREMVWSAFAARAWGMAADWDARCKKIFFRLVDPTTCLVPPGYTDIHDPTCPGFGEEVMMPLSEVRRMKSEGWKNTDDVTADSAARALKGRSGNQPATSTGQTRFEKGAGVQPGPSEQDLVKVTKWWFRYDPLGETEARGNERVYPLNPDEEFARCTGCDHEEFDGFEGYRDQDGALPNDLEDYVSCPKCGKPMEPVRHLAEQDVYEKYPDGRLWIGSVEQGVEFSNDKWPFRTRSFPYMLFRPGVHPRKTFPASDTALNWSLQVIENAMYRFGYEQMSRNTDIILTPLGGLVTSKKEPFRFTDQHGQIAYFSNPLAAQYTKHVQGSGLPAAWATFQQAVAAAFRANVGTSDIQPMAGQTRDIPVGTVEQMVQQGEIPVLDSLSVLQDEEGIFFGCVLDMIIDGAWDEAKWVRTIGPDGSYVMRKLKGAALPQADVFVTTQPRMKQLNQEELETFLKWTEAPPPARRVLAKQLNISPTLLHMYEQDLKKYQDEQSQLDDGLLTDQALRPGQNGPGDEGASRSDLPPTIADRLNGGLIGAPR
jgi:hypothetical protein